MKTSRRRRTALLSADMFALDNEFLRWFASYREFNAASSAGSEIFMGPQASRRFAIGMDADGAVILAAGDIEGDALRSVTWHAASLVRQVQARDWVVLSSRNINIAGASRTVATPARLWLPAEHGKLDGWLGGIPPTRLRLTVASMQSGRPVLYDGVPAIADVPLTLKGVW